MNAKKRFQLSIAGLTVVFIAGLSGAFISGMFLFLKGWDVQRIIIMVFSLGLGIWALLRMIRLNQKEINTRIDGAVNGYHEFIDKWTIGPGQWKQFLKERWDFDRKESNGYGYTVGGVLTFVIAVVGWSTLEAGILVPVLVGSFLIFFALGKWGSIIGARRRFEKQSAFSEGEAHFAEKLIVLNGDLIMLEGFGMRLKSFEVQERFRMTVFSFKVESGYGNRKSYSQFFIPIPERKEADKQRLVKHYERLIS